MKAEQEQSPQVLPVRRAILRELYDSEDFNAARHAEDKEKIEAGTHRFDIHSRQAVYVWPQGFLVDREEDRKQRLERNAAAIKLWSNRYAEVTDDGFIIREIEMAKPKLKLVQSNGA